MPLHFAVITAHPRRDWQSARIIEACARRGEVEVFRPWELGLAVGAGATRVVAGGRDARERDAWLLARAVGERGDAEFQCTTYRALEALGLPVVNPVDALLRAEDKVATSFLLSRAGVPTPPVRAVQRLPEALAALAELGGAVAKPPYGSLGVGVVKLDAGGARARARLQRLLQRHGVAYLQAWVGREPAEDLRLFVVGDEVAAAMVRSAPDGDFRTNVGRGGRSRALRPNADVARIAVSAARALGLAYAGVDVIETDDGPTVLEVNGTPSFRTLSEVTGLDMAEAIVAHAVALIARTRPGPSVGA
jgi:ribosomal protein S6--L-glutamate ligase